MNPQTNIVAHQRLFPPLVDHLLLSQTSTPTKPVDPFNFDPDSLSLRATTISVVLKEILEQRGHIHGGIND